MCSILLKFSTKFISFAPTKLELLGRSWGLKEQITRMLWDYFMRIYCDLGFSKTFNISRFTLQTEDDQKHWLFTQIFLLCSLWIRYLLSFLQLVNKQLFAYKLRCYFITSFSINSCTFGAIYLLDRFAAHWIQYRRHRVNKDNQRQTSFFSGSELVSSVILKLQASSKLGAWPPWSFQKPGGIMKSLVLKEKGGGEGRGAWQGKFYWVNQNHAIGSYRKV